MDLHLYKMLKKLGKGEYVIQPLEINQKIVEYGKKYFILMDISFWVLDRRIYLNIFQGLEKKNFLF